MYYATEKQMERLDNLATKNGLEIKQMMELAGWHIISLFSQLRITKAKKVCVVSGVGNKGGDGLSAARHLTNRGHRVSVVLMRSSKLSPDASHHLKLLNKMNVPVYIFSSSVGKKKIKNTDVIIDSLLGYHLKGAPRGLFKEAIEMINASKAKVIAYDLPSGVSASTGKCYDPCIRADATLSLALPKRAFRVAAGKKKSGKVYLADIGIPIFLYDKIKKGSRPKFEAYTHSLIRL